MFVRVETGFKAEFIDPEARRIQQKIAEIHPQLAEKIRWVRILKCYWLELNAPRDKVIQTVQQVFKIPVTHWLFTGDLLPSAAGSSGTLQDLMQAAPYRPGVFHGIEKRKRIHVHDEEASVLNDLFKTILGEDGSVKSNITGEMLLIEGAKLTQSDLEWIAKHWFAHDQSESWSLIAEDELKKNARFQSDQVAKYLGTAPLEARSRLLQFRQMGQASNKEISWKRVEELFRQSFIVNEKHSSQNEEEWVLQPEIRFASDALLSDTRSETEFHLALQQLDSMAEGYPTILQTVLGVLPNPKRIWFGESYGHHPLRVRDEFETAMKEVSETTATPIVQMKLFEDNHENEPSYFWSSSLGINPQKNEITVPVTDRIELIWIGDDERPAYQDLTYVQNLKSSLQYGRDAKAISFVLSCSGKTLLEVLKKAAPLAYGFELRIDGKESWFQKALESPFALSQIWGVHPEQKEWLFQELKLRGIPFFSIGSNNLSGDVKITQNGSTKLQLTIKDFFKTSMVNPDEVLVDKPLYSFNEKLERRIQPVKFKNRYSVEEVLLKPETYHASIASPVVMRPDPNLWTGIMILSDLCGEEFTAEHMEYLLRKCTALGGQIQSMQISMLNGLKSWYKVIQEVKSDFGIQLTQMELLTKSQSRAHWLALQLVSRMNDIRNIRSEDFKQPNDRIYWLPGGFDHPATRWLAGMEGRYQNSLHSAIAIEPSDINSNEEGQEGVVKTLTFALLKRKLGAELRLQHYFPGGFFVSIGENERYAVEEEWSSMGIECEWVGKVTSTPHLVIRDEDDKVHTISIEDLV
jgi:hypothetical protein